MFYNNDNKRVNQTRKIITAAATCAWSHNEWNRNFGRSGESPHRLLDCPQFLQTNAAPLNQNGHYIKMATTSKWPLHQNGHYLKTTTTTSSSFCTDHPTVFHYTVWLVTASLKKTTNAITNISTNPSLSVICTTNVQRISYNNKLVFIHLFVSINSERISSIFGIGNVGTKLYQF